jgi:PKD repeat protein
METVLIEVSNSPPEAVIIADPMTGETPLEVSFDGSASVDPNGEIVSYRWSFGNGDSAFGERVSYIYETPGDFWAQLAVTDERGAVGRDSVQLIIAQGNLPPVPLGLPRLNVPEDTTSIAIALRDYFEDDRDPVDALSLDLVSISDTTVLASTELATPGDTLIFSPAPDSNGSTNFVVEVIDTEGLSTLDTMEVVIEYVNDPPSFVSGADTLVTTDAGPVTIPGWARDMSPGPANESSQSLSFELSTNNGALFVSGPSVSTDGQLAFEPASDTSGIADITVILRDDGGTERGGVDSSPEVALRIQTNHRPTASFEFVRSGFGSLTVLFDASASLDPDGEIVDYSWDFGDGSVASGAQVSHTFTDTVLTDVVLTVTDNLGATSSTLSAVPVSTESDDVPNEFSISAVYPNPSWSSVAIDFSIPEARSIRVTLVDVRGRVLRRVDFDGEPGHTKKTFDVSTLPAGLYFFRIETGTGSDLRRFTVVR